MTTAAWLIADQAAVLLSAAAWLTAGAAAATRRASIALAVAIAALVSTAAGVVPVLALAERGWWFAQEKVLLGLPLLLGTAALAVVVAGPRLRRRAADLDAASVLVLLTAGYAAVVRFAVTFLAGYPLSAAVTLLAAAAVLAAVLTTWQLLARPPAATGLSRRTFLAGGIAVAGAGGAGLALALRPTADAAGTGAVALTDLAGADGPAPGGARRSFTLTARTATVRLESGREVAAWTFDGTLPGPPITVTEGDFVEVHLVNQNIDDGVTLHWHGYDVPCAADGVAGLTQHPVTPGQRFTYRFRADQVGTYWYHTHHVSHVGVRRGLYGHLVVKPRADPGALDLTLSVHTFDGGSAIVGGSSEHMAAPGTPMRLRLLNTDSDPRRLALHGSAFRVVAVDGRDLVEPGEVTGRQLRLAAGGRHDLTFAMPDGTVTLTVDGRPAVRIRPRPGAADPDPDTLRWPELDLLSYGTSVPVPLRDAAVDKQFTLVLGRRIAMVDGRPRFAHTVNGRGHPSIPDQVVDEGDVVRFTVVNRSLDTHPWHLHGHPVLVLARDGVPSSGSPLWLDTFDVRPGEVWEVVFRASNPGIWMNHCHNLPHADQGMMLRLRYAGIGTPFGGHSGH